MSYPRFFYQSQSDSAEAGISEIVEAILEVIRPQSVADVGAGVGRFLAAFVERGIEDVRGYDQPGIDEDVLCIPRERFVGCDLCQPVEIDRQFDLVVSLETAEHLPEASADTFVETLTGLGPVVVFSAAIPGQGGFRHINEQWQDYWAEKFHDRGYAAVDCLRDRLWTSPNVATFYQQNILMYASEAALAANERLREAHAITQPNRLSCVHPTLYLEKTDPSNATLRQILKVLPRLPMASIQAIRRRLGRL